MKRRAAPRAAGLAGRLYADAQPETYDYTRTYVCGGVCWSTIAFVDDRWAAVDVQEGATLPNCPTPAWDPRRESGCVPYSLAKDGSSVTVNGRTLPLSEDGATITDGESILDRTDLIPAGTRLGTELKNVRSYGSQLTGMSVRTEYLTLTLDGRFALSGEGGLTQGPAGNPSLTVGTVSPDESGTYAFDGRGTLTLNYASGEVVRRAAWVFTGETEARKHLVLDGWYFYTPGEDD